MIDQLFVTLAQAAPTAPSQAANSTWFFVQLIGLGVIFYFLLIRPQQKRAKEQAALISSVKTGDKVILTGGMHGIVSNVKETTILVKVADNVKIEFEKSAVLSVAKASAES